MLGWLAALLPSAHLAQPATTLAWSADGARVAAGNEAGEVLTADATGRVRRLQVPVRAVRLDPDGTHVLGVDGGDFVSVDLATAAVERLPLPERQGHPVSWTRGPYGDLLVTGTVAHFQIRRSGGGPRDADAAPTGNFRDLWVDPRAPLAWIDTGHGLELRHVGTGVTLRALDPRLPDARVLGAVREPEGRLVVLLADPAGVRLWTPPDAVGSAWLGIDPAAPAALSADGHLVGVGGPTGVRVYRSYDRGQHAVFSVRSPVERLAFSPRGDALAVALADGRLQVFPVAPLGRTPVARAPSPLDPGRVGEDTLARGPLPRRAPALRLALGGTTPRVAWGPGGELAGLVGGRLVLADPATGEERAARVPDGAGGRAWAWSADGRGLAVDTNDGVALVDPRTGRATREVPLGSAPSRLDWRGDVLLADLGEGRVAALQPSGEAWSAPYATGEGVSRWALSPDGRDLATTGPSPRVLDARDGTEVAALGAQWGGVVAAAWSPDGARLATAGADDTVLVWDARSWQPIALVEGAGGHELAFSPDGARLVCAGRDGAVIARAEDGAPLEHLEFGGLLTSVDWGAGGILVADGAGNAYLFDGG